MDHIAIDLGGRESQICVMSAAGELLTEERRATRGLAAFFATKKEKARVVMETCAEAFSVADAARKAGHEVVVVPATLVRSLGVGMRGIKTDVRDARNLAEASCRMKRLPAVHIPAETSRERKSMCGLREVLVGTRTKLLNACRGWLRRAGWGPMWRCTPEAFPTRLRKHVADRSGTITAAVERVLVMMETVNVQIAEADAELEKMAKADPICQRLMTVPGVGPVTAVRFAAAVDDVSRFEKAAAVQSYLGLVPGENSSSDRRRITSITKAGSPEVRWTMVQAAWSARRWRKTDAMVRWALEVEARRGRHVAIVALAPKDGRGDVCHLARRHDLRFNQGLVSEELLTGTYAFSGGGGGDGNRLSKGGDRDEDRETPSFGWDDLVAPMATRRRILILVPTSTNSRLGQPASWSARLPRFVLLSPPPTNQKGDGRGSSVLRGQSLHSRSSRRRLRSGAVLAPATPSGRLVSRVSNGRSADRIALCSTLVEVWNRYDI